MTFPQYCMKGRYHFRPQNCALCGHKHNAVHFDFSNTKQNEEIYHILYLLYMHSFHWQCRRLCRHRKNYYQRLRASQNQQNKHCSEKKIMQRATEPAAKKHMLKIISCFLFRPSCFSITCSNGRADVS